MCSQRTWLGLGLVLMLTSSTMLGVVQYYFSARAKTEFESTWNDLRQELNCALCHSRGTFCSGCPDYSRKEEDCQLTKAMEICLRDIVKDRIDESTRELENAMDDVMQANTESEVEYLSKNVPMPSARWYPQHRRRGTGKERRLHKWFSRGAEYGHTLNSLDERNGAMIINQAGWYMLYLQVGFTCDADVNQDDLIYVTVRSKYIKDETETQGYANIIHVDSTPQQNSTDANTICAYLKAHKILKLFKDEALYVYLKAPRYLTMSKRHRNTYFGVQMLRPDELT